MDVELELNGGVENVEVCDEFHPDSDPGSDPGSDRDSDPGSNRDSEPGSNPDSDTESLHPARKNFITVSFEVLNASILNNL